MLFRSLKVNVYKVLEDCVQKGIQSGYNKAHKHTNKPSEDELLNQIEHYVMLEICDMFEFD